MSNSIFTEFVMNMGLRGWKDFLAEAYTRTFGIYPTPTQTDAENERSL